MAAVVDDKMIARHFDRFVFVVEWGKTSQRIALECINDASALLDRAVCIALNKMDPSALRSIEHYKGERFHDYIGSEPEAVGRPRSGAHPCRGALESGTTRQ